jgi:uncharacterized repeat protein (TIGR01451 family)
MSAMRRGRTRSGAAWAAMLLVGSVGSCMSATDVDRLEITATGVVAGVAFLDQNGSGALDAGDVPLEDGVVQLLSQGTQAVVAEETTDSVGVFVMENVALGSYDVRIGAAVLGDSLTSLSTAGTVTIALGDTTVVSLGASYPHLTLEQALAATPGRRVFTAGIALTTRPNNGDGLVFFKGASGYLRGTNVDRAPVAPGDSVRLLGRVTVSQGRPALDAVTPFLLVSSAQLVLPVDVSVPAAGEANGGALDAALVRIQNADIQDTSTVGNDKHFWAHAGGDSVEVVLRSFLGISPNPPIRPDTIVGISQATGLLSPFDDGSGNVRWRLLVRSASEITTVTKNVDVAVTAAFDTTQASAADTVEIRITARNVTGTHTATAVQVSDTIPAALTFLSSTSTKGSYDQATRLWTIGDLVPGAAADTLWIRATVTGGPGTVGTTARLRPLQREVDTNAGNNNGATVPGLTIS